MKHFISLDKAKKMTALFRKEKENKEKVILPMCETFDAEPFRSILNKPGCASIRIYYGLDNEKRVHAIIVGVNGNNEDMISNSGNTIASAGNTTTGIEDTTNDIPETDPPGDDPGDTTDIIEEGQSCPPYCPPPSPLNG